MCIATVQNNSGGHEVQYAKMNAKMSILRELLKGEQIVQTL